MYFSSTLSLPVFWALANAAALSKKAALTGEATYYGGNVAGGTCSFSTYTLPSGIFGTALSDSNWDNSGNCGACISVTGPAGNSVTAMIVDQCPGCGPNHLDLFPDAFSALADPTDGVMGVSWSFIDCPITSPLELHNKEGVSANWFSMQVVNANQRVSSLEVSTDGGSTWQGTTRQTYNFFENSSGFGTTIVDVKVTSVDGDSVIVNNVDISSGASTTASSNFEISSTTTTPATTEAPPSTPITSPATEAESTAQPTETPTTSDAPETLLQLIASSSTSDSTTSTTYSTTTRTSTVLVAGSTTSVYMTSSYSDTTSIGSVTSTTLPVATVSFSNSTSLSTTARFSSISSSLSPSIYSQNATTTLSPTTISSTKATTVPSSSVTNLGARIQMSMLSVVAIGVTAWLLV